MGITVLQEKPLYTDSGAVFSFSTKLIGKFKFVDKFGEPFILYRSENDKIRVPRNCVKFWNEDRTIKGGKIKLPNFFKPRKSGQQEFVDETYKYLSQGLSGISCADTGFGKTILGSALIPMVGRKTVILVHKNDIREQWYDSLKKVCGLERKDIGLIQGDTYNIAGKPVTIAMVQSLAKPNRYPEWVYKDFGFAIFDEVHLMAADFFSNSCWNLPAFLRLGLTATPNRSDGKTSVLHAHLGPVRVHVKGTTLPFKVLRFASSFKLPMVTRKVGVNYKKVKLPHKHGRIMSVVKLLARNDYRNAQLAAMIKMAYDKGRNIVGFSDLKDQHLPAMRKRLIEIGVPSKDIGLYVSGLSKSEAEEVKKKPVVLTTYKMCSTGTNVPRWDTAVLMTPKADVEQIVGRILREPENGEEKAEAVVIEVVDRDSNVLCDYASARDKFYAKRNAKVVYVKVKV